MRPNPRPVVLGLFAALVFAWWQGSRRRRATFRPAPTDLDGPFPFAAIARPTRTPH